MMLHTNIKPSITKEEIDLEPLMIDMKHVLMHHVKKILRDMRDNDRYYQEHFEIIKDMPFVKDLINENNTLRETLKSIHKQDSSKTTKVYLEISPESGIPEMMLALMNIDPTQIKRLK